MTTRTWVDQQCERGMMTKVARRTGQQGIPVQEIDAYWLQRKIAKAFGDIDAT